jgi:Tol biopolymer transport system component
MQSIVVALLFLLAAPVLPLQQTRTQVTTPPYPSAGSLAISPDGTRIVFLGLKDGKNQLWLHSLESGESRALAGTDDVSSPSPCWSPDSKSIAYFGSNSLKRLDLETLATQVLVPAVASGRGCAWNREGTILFSANGRTIYRTTDSAGGSPQPAIPLSTVITTFPRFLQDGRHFIYFGTGEGILISELGGGPPRRLTASDSAGVFASGHLLFARQQTLYAQRFDTETLTLSGEPIVIAQPIGLSIYDIPVSASDNGHLAFRAGAGRVDPQFTWFDRGGKTIGTIGDPVSLAGSPPVLSRDGRWIAMDRGINGNTDLWLLEVSSGKLSRLTEPPGLHIFPLFSPDGQRVYYASNKTGIFEMYERRIEGPADEKLVMARAMARPPRAISSDGRFILYRSFANIIAIQLDGNPRGEFPAVEMSGTAVADWPQFSPDNRWIAFHSTESGRPEVHIQQFPSGRRIQVSKGGGGWPRWSDKEIFYIAPDNRLTAVPVDFLSDPQQPKFGEAVPLFVVPATFNPVNRESPPRYIPSADGQRFLVPAESQVVLPITVTKNWSPGP